MAANRGLPLRAVKLEAFSAATPAGLTAAIAAWIAANAGQRTLLQLDFETNSAAPLYVAYLTYTE